MSKHPDLDPPSDVYPVWSFPPPPKSQSLFRDKVRHTCSLFTLNCSASTEDLLIFVLHFFGECFSGFVFILSLSPVITLQVKQNPASRSRCLCIQARPRVDGCFCTLCFFCCCCCCCCYLEEKLGRAGLQ